jgi:hypothetical protein
MTTTIINPWLLIPALGCVIAAVAIVRAWRRIPPGAVMPSPFKYWYGAVPRGLALTVWGFTHLMLAGLAASLVLQPQFTPFSRDGLMALLAGLVAPLATAWNLARIVAERRRKGRSVRD